MHDFHNPPRSTNGTTPRQPRNPTGLAKSYYLRELIEKGLDDLEDFCLADTTMKRVRKGQESVVDSAGVRRSLGLDNEVHRNRSATTL